jgi:hypothetical protein
MPYRPAVKIVATPGGEAPLDVREGWVGLTLPLTDPTPRMFEPEGVLTLSKQPPRVGYMVEGWKAVDMLAQKAPRAAEWWHEHAPHVLAPCYQLIFSADVCEIVQGTEWRRAKTLCLPDIYSARCKGLNELPAS